MLVEVKTASVVVEVEIVAVDVAVRTGSVEVAASNISGVVVALIPGIEEVASVPIPRIEESTEDGGRILGITVEPHAPSEVFMTPPSIYIHFGAAVALLKNIKFIAEEE